MLGEMLQDKPLLFYVRWLPVDRTSWVTPAQAELPRTSSYRTGGDPGSRTAAIASTPVPVADVFPHR